MCNRPLTDNFKLNTPLDRNERQQIMTDFDLLHENIMGTLANFFKEKDKK